MRQLSGEHARQGAGQIQPTGENYAGALTLFAPGLTGGWGPHVCLRDVCKLPESHAPQPLNPFRNGLLVFPTLPDPENSQQVSYLVGTMNPRNRRCPIEPDSGNPRHVNASFCWPVQQRNQYGHPKAT